MNVIISEEIPEPHDRKTVPQRIGKICDDFMILPYEAAN